MLDTVVHEKRIVFYWPIAFNVKTEARAIIFFIKLQFSDF